MSTPFSFQNLLEASLGVALLLCDGAQAAAPLIAERYNGRWAMDSWRDAGVPADKLVMGVPYYGRAWGGVPAAGDGLYQPAGHVPGWTWDDRSSGATGVNDGWEVALMEQSSAYTRHWDALAKVPWLFAPGVEGGHFVSHDDPQSVGEKVRCIQRRGYGGAMFWEFSGDRNELLMDVLDSRLR
jgi:chitinase